MVDPENLKKMDKDEIIECCSNIADWGFNDYDEWEQQSAVYGLLDLYKKQQKEIENSISKDKIKEKLEIERIKALDRFDNKLNVTQRIYKRNVQVALIDKLKKELLEENNND